MTGYVRFGHEDDEGPVLIPIYDVDDAVRYKDIWNCDLRRVHIYRAVYDGNGNVRPRQRCQCGVSQHTTVSDRPLNDMIRQNTSELSGGEIAKGRTDGIEGSIARSEDRHILLGIEGIDQTGSVGGTSKRSQPGSDCGIIRSERDGQYFVDDMKDPASEVDVLEDVISTKFTMDDEGGSIRRRSRWTAIGLPI